MIWRWRARVAVETMIRSFAVTDRATAGTRYPSDFPVPVPACTRTCDSLANDAATVCAMSRCPWRGDPPRAPTAVLSSKSMSGWAVASLTVGEHTPSTGRKREVARGSFYVPKGS